MNKLWGSRAYLCGAIDRTADLGIGWRNEITPNLENLGIVVEDPCNKPIDVGFEIENREYRNNLKKDGQYSIIAKKMKDVRIIDLRLVDICDFLIVYLDLSIHVCGTYEEISWANRMKKPILIVVKQGKYECPDWLFGSIPDNMIFSSFEEMMNYLKKIDSGEESYKSRWILFDYKKMLPKSITEFLEKNNFFKDKI